MNIRGSRHSRLDPRKSLLYVARLEDILIRRFCSRFAFPVVVTTAVLAVTAATASAMMVERLALDEVTRRAATIVHATVAAVRSDRDESGLPATWITLNVTRTLKGPAAASLTIKEYGVLSPLPDGTITRTAGPLRYAVGDEVVLFLHQNSGRGFTSPVGSGQGAYRVRRDEAQPMVRSDTPDGSPVALDNFLTEVATLVATSP